MIKSKLDKIKDRISDPSFLANKGLSNEVGIHVFCYDPKDEIVVQDYVSRLKNEVNTPYRIIECDLYEIFLSLLEDKRVLRSVDSLEEKPRQRLSSQSVAEDRNTRGFTCSYGLLSPCKGAGCIVYDRYRKNPSVHAFP